MKNRPANTFLLRVWRWRWTFVWCVVVAVYARHKGLGRSAATSTVHGSDDTDEYACVWGPEHDTPCVERVSEQIRYSLRHTVPLHHHRWLFFGDSTMFRLWTQSALSTYLTNATAMKEYCPPLTCTPVYASDCNINESILRQPSPAHWTLPSLAEGPMANGLRNHSCHDCEGCDSTILECHKDSASRLESLTCTSNTTHRPAAYGGYIAIEFARDVEIQTSDFVTSQENILHYVQQVWNTPDLVTLFGRPICVVGTGLHDISLSNITLDLYMTNVQWYTSLLLNVCDHIVWVGNNSPIVDDFDNERATIYEWNVAIRDYLSTLDHTSFVDVYNASQVYPHSDNLHMSTEWYNAVASMFLQIIG